MSEPHGSSTTATTPPSSSADGARAIGHLKSTAQHGLVYAIGIILSRIVAFLMIPIYTRVLSPADYGILEILSLTTEVVAMLAGVGIGLAVIRSHHQVETVEEQSTIASTAALLLLTIFGIAAAIGIAAAGPLAELLLGDAAGDAGPLYVRLAVFGMFCGGLLEVPMALLRARQRSSAVVTVSLVRLALSLSLNIVLVVWLRVGVVGVLWSTAITTALISGWLFVQLLREHGVRPTRAVAKQLAAFGAPLVIWNLASFVLHYSDRYFLRVYTSMDTVGLYSLSYKLAMLLSMFVIGPFSDAWIPKSLEIEKREGEGAVPTLRLITGYYNLLLVSIGLALALFAGDIITIATGARFHGAADTVPILVVAMVFFGYRAVGQLGALIRGRSDLIAIGATVAAVVVTILNVALIPRFGVTGAALATLLAFLTEFLVMRALSSRVFPDVIRLAALFAPGAIAIGVWLASVAATALTSSLVLRLVIHASAMALFAVLLRAVGVIGPTEVGFVTALLRDPRGAARRLRGG